MSARLKPVAVLFSILALGGQEGSVQGQGIFCPICGEGRNITRPGVMFEGNNCSTWSDLGFASMITEAQCGEVQGSAFELCGCLAPGETFSPTTFPSTPPSYGPNPECFDSLEPIDQREWFNDRIDDSVFREYVLCPNTDFKVGRQAPGVGGGIFNGGSRPIFPRNNILYKCGADGLRLNNCRIYHGDFLVLGTTIARNVTFQGFTFDNAFDRTLVFAGAIEITFIDCAITNNQNKATVFSFFSDARRRRQLEFSDDRDQAFMEVKKLLGEIEAEGEEYALGDTLEEDADESGRGLQGSNPDILTTQTFVFRDCVFDNNKVVPLSASQNPSQFYPGIITFASSKVSLTIDNCIFSNNDFGAGDDNPPATYAIQTSGPLVVKDSCFLNNDFVRGSPIQVFGDDVSVEVSNNFGTTDEDVACQFVGLFPTSDAFAELVNFTCLEYDASSCQASADPVVGSEPTPSPTKEPTRPTRVDPADTDAPVPVPTMAPDLSGAGQCSVMLLWTVISQIILLLV